MRVALNIPPGINLDDTSLSDAGRWADADKVRFRMGKTQAIGGWERATLTAATGVCRSVFPWTDNGGALNIALGTHSKLQVVYGTTVYDITPSGLAAGNINGVGSRGFGTGGFGKGLYGTPSTTFSSPRTWSLAPWGQNLMASPRAGTIYQWTNNTASAAVAVTNAPAQVTAMLVVKQRQVIAFGCNEEASGTFNPMCIRYTDLEDPTAWTTSVTNNAGEIVLEGGGRLVGAALIGDGFMCWTDSSVYLGTYVGDFGQTWRVDRVATGCGLIGPQAMAIFGQTAFWLSPQGQFFTCAMGSEPTPLACPVRADMVSHIAAVQQEKIVASVVAAYGEVWWFYPDIRDGYENSRAVFLSTAEDGLPWSKAIIARTAFCAGSPADHPIGVSPTGSVYFHERGTTADGSNLTGFIESADQYLDETQTVFQVQRLIPDITQQVGDVSMTVVTRMEPQASEAQTGPYTMSPGTTRVDLRKTARLARLRLDFNAQNAAWRLGTPIVVLERARQR